MFGVSSVILSTLLPVISSAAFVAVLATTASPHLAHAQAPFDGWTLVSDATSETNELIALDGTVVQAWTGNGRPGTFAYLLENDTILRAGRDPGREGMTGRLQMIDGTNTVVWDYYFAGDDYTQHHDIEPMSNGNVLVLAWERRTNSEVLAAGRMGVTGDMTPTYIAELMPTGPTSAEVVWEWRAWDHLIQNVDPALPNFGQPSDHPGRFDVNFAGVHPMTGDWIHANSIDYDPVHDQIVFSSRAWSEVFVIDHSTTTAEAAGSTGGNSGKGGDILYRWGNPEAYGRGTETDRDLHIVHGANWIDEDCPGNGNILLFQNGGDGIDYSSVFEITPPRNPDGTFDVPLTEPFGPATPIWSYGGPGDFYGGPTHCGAFRLPNGNTLITSRAESRVFEVTLGGQQVWEFVHPTGTVNRALRYGNAASSVESGADSNSFVSLFVASPNPVIGSTRIQFQIDGAESREVSLDAYSVTGRHVATLLRAHVFPGLQTVSWEGRAEDGSRVPPGAYFLRLASGSHELSRRVLVVR